MVSKNVHNIFLYLEKFDEICRLVLVTINKSLELYI